MSAGMSAAPHSAKGSSTGLSPAVRTMLATADTRTNRQRRAAVAAIGALLERRFPNVFRARGLAPVPLRVGIERELVQALPGVERTLLSEAVQTYRRRGAYLSACVEGARRFDLAGRPVAAVSGGEAAWAAARLRERDASVACRALRMIAAAPLADLSATDGPHLQAIARAALARLRGPDAAADGEDDGE